jgi:glucokinase
MKINHLVGVDMGGSHYSVGIFTPEGILLDYRKVSTIIRGNAQQVLHDMALLIRETMGMNQAEPNGTVIGLGMPGPQDRRRGVITKAHNLGWYDIPVTEPLSEYIGSPCFMENDAVAATCGEWWQGAGRGAKHLVDGFNPEKVVVGGAIALAGEVLFAPLRERLAVRVFPAARPTLSVEPFLLGDRSAVYGAAVQAFYRAQGIV